MDSDNLDLRVEGYCKDGHSGVACREPGDFELRKRYHAARGVIGV